MKAVVAQTGVLKGKNRRALDSTVLDDAVATRDTVTQLSAVIRKVAREAPDAAAVVAKKCTAHDYDDPGRPRVAWDDAGARAALCAASRCSSYVKGARPRTGRIFAAGGRRNLVPVR